VCFNKEVFKIYCSGKHLLPIKATLMHHHINY
jgi:hypothetical protein